MESHSTFVKAPRYVLRKHNILKFVSDLPDVKSFLDVGCGAGELDCTLAERGLRGVGLDFSNDAVAIAATMRAERHISPKRLQFYTGGLEQIKRQTFDIVLCCEVLEHVEDDAALLHDVATHAQKYLIISVPAKQRLFDASDKAVGHFRRYEKSELTKLLNDEGLEIITFINYGYPFTNAVRLLRKASFVKKLRQNTDSSMENKSKESGINPVKLPKVLQKLDTEKLSRPLYHVSRVFNRTNLGEGYLVVCRKIQKTD